MNKVVPNKRLNYRKVAHPNYVLSRWFLNFRFAYLLKKPSLTDCFLGMVLRYILMRVTLS